MKTINREVDPRYLACPIRQVVSKFGDKWSLLVLYTLGRSEQDRLRYSELHQQMLDCSQKMLSQTLKNLEANHLVNRKIYPEVPPRVEYSLTDVGRSLIGPLNVLVDWSKENMSKIID
ncbi:MAG TPA: helix-turn-helix domain-containing protein [Prevotella sp.]